MNKQELLSYLKKAQTHLSEIEILTESHNKIMKKLYLQIPPELSEDKEEVAISWSMYLFKG